MRLVIRLTRWERWWQQALCAYRHDDHGHLWVGQNHLSIYCSECGFESSGIDLETRRVRTHWMWDRQRSRNKWSSRRSA